MENNKNKEAEELNAVKIETAEEGKTQAANVISFASKRDETLVIKPKKPYVFEHREYSEIDLNGLSKLCIMDAINAQKAMFGEKEVAGAMMSETTTAFARQLAAKASGLPIEFFKMMPRGLSKLVERTVQSALNVDLHTENHVMRFEKPYSYQGETYTEIDLNAVADLNSMNESAAENKVARMGFPITETSLNYYYSCVLASMATGKPEEFFTGLPLCEVLKLKHAVNADDFFE